MDTLEQIRRNIAYIEYDLDECDGEGFTRDERFWMEEYRQIATRFLGLMGNEHG